MENNNDIFDMIANLSSTTYTTPVVEDAHQKEEEFKLDSSIDVNPIEEQIIEEQPAEEQSVDQSAVEQHEVQQENEKEQVEEVAQVPEIPEQKETVESPQKAPAKRGRKPKAKAVEEIQPAEETGEKDSTETDRIAEITNEIVEEMIDDGTIAVKEEPETKKTQTKNVNIDYSKIDLETIVSKIYPTIVDENWDNFKERMEEKLNKTVFDENINDGSIRIVLAAMCSIYAEVSPVKAYYDSLYNSCVHKDMGYISRQIALNSDNGKTVAEKKLNGQKSCESVRLPGTKIDVNFNNFALVVDERRNYINNIINRLNFVRDCLVGIQAVRKREVEGA